MGPFETLVPIAAIVVLFIGLPWLILHYVTKWKQASTLTVEDENLLDELHDMARRLDERVHTIERIIAAERDLPAPIARLERPAADIDDLGPAARETARRNGGQG